MNRSRIGAGILSLAPVAGTALADRTPSTRVPSPAPATGPRPDITVPYTTDGRSTLMYAGKVAPRIYQSPTVDDPKNPGARPTFNLPFYGSVMSFGDRSNGAVSKPGASRSPTVKPPCSRHCPPACSPPRPPPTWRRRRRAARWKPAASWWCRSTPKAASKQSAGRHPPSCTAAPTSSW